MSKLVEHLKNDGVLATLRWGVSSVFYYPIINRIDHQFDRKFGTDTSRYLDPSRFSVASEMVAHANEYSPSPDSVFRSFLKQQALDYSTYSFVDLGCGKGRTVMLAAQFPFKKAIGVEFEPTLHRICEENIQLYSSKCKKAYCAMEVVCGDAGEFTFPSGNILLYLFNPFDNYVMEKVVERIKNALDSESRFFRIIYFHPNHLDAFYTIPGINLLVDKTFKDRKSLNDTGRVTVLEVASRSIASS